MQITIKPMVKGHICGVYRISWHGGNLLNEVYLKIHGEQSSRVCVCVCERLSPK